MKNETEENHIEKKKNFHRAKLCACSVHSSEFFFVFSLFCLIAFLKSRFTSPFRSAISLSRPKLGVKKHELANGEKIRPAAETTFWCKIQKPARTKERHSRPLRKIFSIVIIN